MPAPLAPAARTPESEPVATVAVIAGRTRVTLDPAADLKEPAVVPAQHLTLEIEAADLPETATLDGRELPLVRFAANRAFSVVDTSGSVGFHCLRIGEDAWYFATQDAKLRLVGILSILDVIQEEGLGWSGQLFFANGSTVRHPKVDYAWLEQAAAKIAAVADAIAERPLRRSQVVERLQPPGVGRLSLRKTVALLRRNSRSLLTPDEKGPLVVEGQAYAPRLVVAGRPERTAIAVVGNRRMTELLLLTLDLARSLQSEPRIPKAAAATLSAIAHELDNRLELFPFTQLRRHPSRLPTRPAPEEVADDRYRLAFELHEELTRDLVWQAGLQRADRLAYVQSADQIYQAFVASALARAFEARQVVSSLRGELTTPIFRSSSLEIYYDTVPPKPAFANWRDGSARPTEQKPDLTIIDVAAQRGILLDAKYRVEPSGRLPTSGIHDAQVYLQSFERKSVVICYPGSGPSMTRIAAKGYTILEVSLAPFVGLDAYLRDEVRPAIEAIMEPLGG